ncbi:CPBP family intramembrane glutamic endopeptidase [Agathobacter sp.]
MSQSKSIRKIWIYLVGIIVLPIVLSIILGILQAIAGENNISDGLALSVINLVSYLFPFIFYIKLYGGAVLNDKKNTRFVTLIKYLGIFILCTAAYGFFKAVFNINEAVSNNQETLNEVYGFSIFVGILVTCIFAPFVEEIVYRYILQDWIDSKIKNKIVVILISAGIFALIHMGEIDLWIFGDYFVSALVLTILYYKKHNIYANIVVHSLYNILQLVLGILLAL